MTSVVVGATYFCGKTFDTKRFVTKCLRKDRDPSSRNRAGIAFPSACSKSPMNHLSPSRIGLLLTIAIICLGGGCSMSEITGSYSEESFDRLIGQDKLVLVKFGSKSCGPCNRLDEELDSIKADPPAGVEIHSLSLCGNQDLARKFKITGIPRMMLFREGQKLGDHVGYQSEEQIRSWISSQNNIVGDVHSNPFATKAPNGNEVTPQKS